MNLALPSISKSAASAANFGSLAKLLLFDGRQMSIPFVRWNAERIPDGTKWGMGVKVPFQPGSASLSYPGKLSESGPSTAVSIEWETLDDSEATLNWLQALMYRPLFVIAYPTLNGVPKCFQFVRLSYEYQATSDYKQAPSYRVKLSERGQVKIWYTDADSLPASIDPETPVDPANPNPSKEFDDSFDSGFA